MCQVQFDKQEHYLVVTLTGEFVLGCTSEIKDQVKSAAERYGIYRLIIDLSGVSFMDSSGLGTLIAWFKLANQQQGEVVFCGLTSHVAKIVGFAKLDKIFTITENLAQAKAMLVG